MLQKICRWILYRVLGWTKEVTIDHPDKCIICVAPHTTNWDLLIGQLYAHAEGWQVNFLMKKEWFFWPLGPIFRYLGGIPVFRSKHTHMTDALAETARKADRITLCITPEGTRSLNSDWKKGFYYIARGAEIPILLYGIDYNKKLIKCTQQIVPNGNIDDQMKEIKLYFKDFKGKHPEKFTIGALMLLATMMMPLNISAQYLDGNTRAWGDINYDGDPWVYNVSRPNLITKGLMNRHISLWASHGRYYDAEHKRWAWQRPNLFCTTEDLFTQTIVVPFLMPMLENAGAVVWTPRERDWQINEIIVDNDDSHAPYYTEDNRGKSWKQCDSVGFKMHEGIYYDGENPFTSGTLRQIKASKKEKTSFISYQPNIPKSGNYAVYVSYQTMPKSVSDARYIVYHQGQSTEFTVNQKMGGGTWVYLGNFDFDQGCNTSNRVVVTGHASKRGVITSDAVRFGGGMGNIDRGSGISGLPRCLEGARYSAQWAGAPYKVYSDKKGTNDYADDINVRSLMTNWLGGGSIYMPTLDGKKVPFELSLAVHSDAGFAPDGKGYIGTLSICTTNFNDGKLNSGIDRMTSRDFATALRDNVYTDIMARYHNWSKRYVWDKNYSETRLPAIPSAILETLAHQNFPDMKLAQDPMFRFTLARSIYKTILRYISTNHGLKYIVEPLPPTHFAVDVDTLGIAHLSWLPQNDPQEQTATATSFNLYTSTGKLGFDNGKNLSGISNQIQLQPDILYTFKVTACNAGGESFPSETLAAEYIPGAKKNILIVNGFHRLASPQVIDNDSTQGFDIDQDPGVSYGLTAGWNGRQQCFDRSKIGIEGPGGLGYGGDEMVGKFVKGNDFNYTKAHAEAIATTGKYNISSCSSQALTSGQITITKYKGVDLILGLERYDGYTPEFYKTFTPSLQKQLRTYTLSGGGLLVSGSYIASDMQSPDEQNFLKEILKVKYAPVDSIQPNDTVTGMGMTVSYYHTLNEDHYAATHPDVIQPVNSAICTMKYQTGLSAAVGYQGNDYRSFTMGFPLECIKDTTQRNAVMRGILNYIIK